MAKIQASAKRTLSDILVFLKRKKHPFQIGKSQEVIQ